MKFSLEQFLFGFFQYNIVLQGNWKLHMCKKNIYILTFFLLNFSKFELILYIFKNIGSLKPVKINKLICFGLNDLHNKWHTNQYLNRKGGWERDPLPRPGSLSTFSTPVRPSWVWLEKSFGSINFLFIYWVDNPNTLNRVYNPTQFFIFFFFL